MKKLLSFAFLFVFVFSAITPTAGAVTIAELQAQIQSLQAQIQALVAQDSGGDVVGGSPSSPAGVVGSQGGVVNYVNGLADVYTVHNYNKTWQVLYSPNARTWMVKKTDDKTGATDWTHLDISSVDVLGNNQNCGLVDKESNKEGCIGSSVYRANMSLINATNLPTSSDNRAVSVWLASGRIAAYQIVYIPATQTWASQKIQADNTTWTHPGITVAGLQDECRAIQKDNQSGTLISKVHISLNYKQIVIGLVSYFVVGPLLQPWIDSANDAMFVMGTRSYEIPGYVKLIADARSYTQYTNTKLGADGVDEVLVNNCAYAAVTGAIASLSVPFDPNAASVSPLKPWDTVRASQNLNVREAQGATARLLKTLPAGTIGTLIMGPVTTDLSSQNGARWWMVRWPGNFQGWSAEDYLTKISTPTNTTTITNTVSTPTVNVWATPTSITAGQSATINWTSTNATKCLGPNDVRGNSGPSGSQMVYPTATMPYYVFCYNGDSINGSIPPSANNGVTVTVQNSTTQTTTANNGSCNITSFTANGTSYTQSPMQGITLNVSDPSALAIANLNYIANGCNHIDLIQTTNGVDSVSRQTDSGYANIIVNPFFVSWSNVTGANQSTYTLKGYRNSYDVNPSDTKSLTIYKTSSSPSVPTVELSFTPGPLIVTSGSPSVISWSSTNTTRCSAPWTTLTTTSGTATVYPTQTTSYTMTCYNSAGVSANDSLTVQTSVVQTPVISFIATPSSIIVGQSTTITWSATNATTCNVGILSSGTNTSGSVTISPTASTGYGITCYNGASGPYAMKNLTVTVSPLLNSTAPTVSLTANPTSITAGQSTRITLNSSADTARCLWPNEVLMWPVFKDLYPTQTSTYSATCYNSAGISTTVNTTVTVSPVIVVPSPRVTVAINPSYNFGSSNVLPGTSSVLDWHGYNVSSCSAPWIGTQYNNGAGEIYNSQSVGPIYQTTTYTVTCTGTNGTTASANVTINVSQPTATVPVVPTGLSATSGSCDSHTISLSWSAVSNAISYSIYGGNNAFYGGMPLQVTISGTSYSDSGVTSASGGFTPGATYSYYVTARNSVGESSPSQTVSAVAPSACPTSAPTGGGSVHGPAVIMNQQESNLASVVASLDALIKSFQEYLNQGR